MELGARGARDSAPVRGHAPLIPLLAGGAGRSAPGARRLHGAHILPAGGAGAPHFATVQAHQEHIAVATRPQG